MVVCDPSIACLLGNGWVRGPCFPRNAATIHHRLTYYMSAFLCIIHVLLRKFWNIKSFNEKLNMRYVNERKATEDLWRKNPENLKKNNILFRMEGNKSRWEVCLRSERILDKSGRLLVTKGDVYKSLRENFKELVEMVRVAKGGSENNSNALKRRGREQ